MRAYKVVCSYIGDSLSVHHIDVSYYATKEAAAAECERRNDVMQMADMKTMEENYFVKEIEIKE